MSVYKCKSSKLAGSNFSEVHKKARQFYEKIKNKSKRKPYIRSMYFKKEKIFIDLFWGHLYEKKNVWDKIRRLRFFPCAIELIKNSNFAPSSKINPNKSLEILHRFYGSTKNRELFIVQIKEIKSSGKKKWFMSTFPSQE